jgi:NDP-sugar pyrophosphorylase family protein
MEMCLGPIENIRAVVLAGGKGTRLKPYTTIFPKPLVPIGEMPILEIVLRQLKYFGFKKITLSVNHLANLIKTFFADGSSLGLDIDYCLEDKPLGTAGSISLVDDLTDPFLVMNGDLLTTMDYTQLLNHHVTSDAVATIGVHQRTAKVDFGVLEIDADDNLVAYKEKPNLDFTVSMGINVLSQTAVEYIPRGEYLDIPSLMQRLIQDDRCVKTYRTDCDWLDIGRPDDYEAAILEFERSREKYLKS